MPDTPETAAADEDHDFGERANNAQSRQAGTKALTPTARPKMVGGLPPSMGSRRRRSHGRGGEGGSRSQSRTKKIGQLRLMVTLLVVVVVFTAIAAIYYWSKIDVLDAEVLSLSTDLSHAQKELDKARELLRQQDSEINAMLARRIPGLAEITFDTLFNLNDRYVRKLTFSQSGIGTEKVMEFHMVMENKTGAPIVPNVRIILFDRMGLQVGVTQVGKEQATQAAVVAELRADETRTYVGTVLAEPGSEPRYFLVQIK